MHASNYRPAIILQSPTQQPPPRSQTDTGRCFPHTSLRPFFSPCLANVSRRRADVREHLKRFVGETKVTLNPTGRCAFPHQNANPMVFPVNSFIIHAHASCCLCWPRPLPPPRRSPPFPRFSPPSFWPSGARASPPPNVRAAVASRLDRSICVRIVLAR